MCSLETNNKSMSEKTISKIKRDARRAAIIKDTAEIEGVSVRQVQHVLNGERENECVLTTFMEINERYDEVLKEVRNWTSIFNKSPKPTNTI